MRLLTFLTLGWLASSVNADIYLQYPRGANNRLDEANRDRNNGNRLYDTQNNNRGGVNAGNHRDRQYFYEGSILPVSWTVQHGCGSSIGSCQMILQYMCDPEARDGINKNDGNPAVTNADEPERGRHESKEYYARCWYRQRNQGLFTADQRMNNRNAAIYTRQDNQGTRYAFECPEERDYYPYWEPTPWIDVAILTTNTERCPAYQAESQNVKGRWSCNVEITEARKQRQGFVPITKAGCEDPSIGGTWTYYPPHNAFNPSIRAPECKPTQASRDNHHGNPIGERYTAHYNWTIPATYGDSCVFRIRYNITTGDFPYGGFDSWTTLGAGIDSESNQDADAPEGNDNIGYFEPTKYDIWTRYGLNFSDIATSFRRPQPATKVQVTANELLSRGYVFKGQNNDQATPTSRYPQVDIFGSLVPARQPLQLALDSSQFGRTFQDRTHVFSIRQRLPQHQGLKIYNVGVRGRRGNIVQCYPSTEYDFVPDRLQVTVGDLVHFQWMGSDNAGNNDGQAPNNKDRSNIVVMRKHQYREYGADNAHGIAQFTNETGHLGQYYPGLINDTREYPFLGFGFNDLQQLALQGLNFSYFDLGPRQITRAGVYHYIGTRNSAFSNRNQVATIVVLPSTSSDDPFASSAAATSYNDAIRTWTDHGWLYMGDYNTDGAMTGAQLQMIDMGGDGDSHIHLVLPKLFTVGEGQDVVVNIKHKKVGLNIGRMYWRAETTDEWMELSGYSDQGDYTEYHVTANSPVSGGYYKVVNGPNGPAIAGVVIGILIFFAICVAIYWKVRVQPAGGWSIWWATVRPRRSSATAPTKKLDAYKTDSSAGKSIQLESPSQPTLPTLPTPAPKPVYIPNPAVTTNTPYQMPHMAHSRV